jgi:mutator protein MutT
MEQKQITIVLGIVKNEYGHYLLGKRNEPALPGIHEKWNILGGKIEFGEKAEQAVVREIKEESGLDVKVVRLLPRIFERLRQKDNNASIHIIEIPYECEIVGGELLPKSNDPKVGELKFIDPNELDKHDLVEGEEEVFELMRRIGDQTIKH